MKFKNVIDGEFEEVKDDSYQKKKEQKTRREKKEKKPKEHKERKPIKGKKAVFSVIGIIILLLGFLYIINDYYIEYLWFKEVSYLDVFFKGITAKLTLGIPFFIIMLIISLSYFNFLFSVIRKGYNKVGSFGNKIKILISVVYSVVVSGAFIYKLWYKFLEFKNAVPFNQADSLFGKDISFYVFKLPFFTALIKLLFASVTLLFVITILIFIILRVTGNREIYIEKENGVSREERLNFFMKIWDFIKVPCSIFVCVLFILGSIYSYLSMFNVLYSSSGIVYGATYSDVTITVNMYKFFTGLCALLAVVSLVFGLRNKLKPIIIGALIIPIVYFSLGGIKVLVENYIVIPNEYAKEQKYIENNIKMTRKAYNIDEVEVKRFEGNNDLTAKDIANNSITVGNIPINDFEPTLDVYNSLQSFRSYYSFKDVDVDRYTLDKVATQVFISVREMDPSNKENARTWVNKHQKYTHGFGTVVSPVTEINESGQPVLIQKDIPPSTAYDELKIDEPRVYFGESSDDYVIVNTKSKEFDYPEGNNNVENKYTGSGGIKLSLYNRLAFSVSNMSSRLLFSSDITGESKILMRRQVAERVTTIAPFLTYDKDPYIVNSNGKLYWIMDAFTKTNKYPYSTPSKFEDGTKFNYIRNSIKVVVDAYNGTVNFYQVDKNDPIASTYAKIYPGFIKPIEQMDKTLKEHLRYSEVLFNIQSEMYENYHMTNPQVFYNKEDQWQVAKQFYGTKKEAVDVNSSYLIMKLPDRKKEEFIIMAPFTPKNKNNMVAWMGGICDGEDYGKLKVYQLPKQKLVYGPMQIEQRIDQDTTIAPQLNLLSQVSSEVSRGNMLTIPIEDSILYVEPIYVKSSTDQMALPEVKEVIVAYGNKIVMRDSLTEAINAIFNLGEGGDGVTGIVDDAIDKATKDNTKTDLEKKSRELLTKAKEAQAKGDTKAYTKYMSELEKVLDQISE